MSLFNYRFYFFNYLCQNDSILSMAFFLTYAVCNNKI